MSQEGPVVKTQMLIRRPVDEVFEAFVDPAITSKFWFTKGSDRLKVGKKVVWEWEMYGAAGEIVVKALELNTRILIEWNEPPTPVEWQFSDRGDEGTLVRIASWGFSGGEEEAVAKALDSMGGFTNVLAGLKAWLEHGLQLNLVGDHYPDAHKE